ncbi:MAG: hypoxanthine phosphoribosyltransferase [Bermanella sp.]|jgi:hypoxanthine phosphoribosyltransferase
MQKHFISAQALLDDAFELAAMVIESGFRPDCIIALWRGGTPVGIAVQELFECCGLAVDHIAIRTSLYSGVGQRERRVKVHNLDYIFNNFSTNNKLLIVDDVFDTGLTLKAVLAEIRNNLGVGQQGDIRLAVPWFKPARNQAAIKPDYYLRETDDWLVFPHEICDLSREEMGAKGGRVAEIVDRMGALTAKKPSL